MIVYGKDCDSTIFKRSTLCISIQTNMVELPIERPLSGTEGPSLPHLFVRHEVLALNRKIFRSFRGSQLSVKKKESTTIACEQHEGMWNVLPEILSNKW